MTKFFLYKKETEKPHLVLFVGERAWIIPFLDPFKPREKRLAVEICPDADVKTRPLCSSPDLVESGNVLINIESKGKVDFTVSGGSGRFIRGNFVFILPSWGRNTRRRLWFFVKSLKEA